MKKYTEDHEWVEVNGDIATVGITDHAQSELGDIVFVELPKVGAELASGDEAAVIESVKAAGEVNNPVSGEVVEANDALVDAPETINRDPEGDGWIYKIRLNDDAELGELMDEDAYQDFIS